MSVSLYEKFMAVGSVKSLLTGQEYSRNTPQQEKNLPPATEEKTPVQSYTSTDR